MADEETFLDLAAAERHAWAASEYDGQCVTCALVNALRWSREDADEGDQIRSKMSTLLSRTAVALNGPEPELTMWSWHDLPEKAQAAMDALARVRAVEPENAATSSRDYGRGYAQAIRDVRDALSGTGNDGLTDDERAAFAEKFYTVGEGAIPRREEETP